MRFGGTKRVHGMITLALLLGAVPAYSRPHATQAASTSEVAGSPVVVRVRIVREDGHVLVESPSGITVEAGKPLDRENVAQSLRALYRTGDYADLRAVVSPENEGVRLDFVARENLFFNVVRLEGLEPPPSEASAVAAMQIGLGQTYRKEIVEEALERLRETLHDEGLYRAEVSAETVPHPETHQIDVIVQVKPGPRARVASVQLKNDTAYRDSTLLSRFKMKAGQAITSARLQRGTERVRKFLAEKGHLSARVTVRRGEFDAAKNAAAIFLEVTQGPRVEVSVNGAKFSEGELKRLIPIYQEGAVDPDLLEEGKRNVRERLERQGYFDADVSYKIGMHDVKTSAWQGMQETITYTVERGDRHKLVGIEISGNKYFDTELLKSRLQIFQGAFGSPGRFSRRLVDLDAQSMQSLYQANGFLDARVIPWVEDNYKGKEGDLFISFTVEEGRQTRVASLSIEGTHAFKEEELLGVIGSTPGQPYSDFGVTTDRDNILALYFNEGFPEATFTATAERAPATPAEDEASVTSPHGSPPGVEKKEQSKKAARPPVEQADEVRLVYHIQEGPQTRVRRVLISGYEHTRPGVIRREVRIKPQQPLR